jgi:hypothetical protein
MQQFTLTVYTGPEPLAATEGHVGNWQTLAEFQTRETWTPRLRQTFDISYTADPNDPANQMHNSASTDSFITTSYILTRSLALNNRLEWFNDPHGTTAAIPGTYSDAAAGVTIRPDSRIEFRPEVRGDFSGQPSFGSADSAIRHRDQLSFGVEVLIKERFF